MTVGGGDLQGGDITGVVRGLKGVDVVDGRRRMGKKKGLDRKGGRAWILKKKEQMERKGKIVKQSSKYTGRKRGPVF